MINTIVENEAKEPENRQLCEDYWRFNEKGDWQFKVRDIAEQYGLKSYQVSERASSLSRLLVKEVSCVSCGNLKPIFSRSDYKDEVVRSKSWQYEKESKNWKCHPCIKNAKEREKQEFLDLASANRKEMVKAIESRKPGNLCVDELTPGEMLDLMALLISTTDEEMSDWLKPVNAVPHRRMWPSKKTSFEKLLGLYKRGAIAVDPASKDQSITGGPEKPTAFFPEEVGWKLMVTHSKEATEYSTSATAQRLGQSVSDPEFKMLYNEELYDIGMAIAFDDCHAYLRMLLEERNLYPLEGEVTRDVIKEALEHVSVGVIHRFMFTAARAASDRLRKGEVQSRKHASNQIPAHLRNLVKKSIDQGWNSTPYERREDFPESDISKIFFSHVLGKKSASYDEVVPDLIKAVLPADDEVFNE